MVWKPGPDGLTALALMTWAVWLTVVVLRLMATTRYLGQPGGVIALHEYLGFIDKFRSETPLYIPGDLHGFHYLPVMLMIGTPLSFVDIQLAGALFGILSAVLFAFSVVRLAQQITPDTPFASAGLMLAISTTTTVMALYLLQMQMLMTAAMILAAVAAMEERPRQMAVWLLVAVALKPLAIVMALLAAVVVPRTRLPLLLGIAVLLVLPFAVRSFSYMTTEYANYIRQLSHITDAVPGAWDDQTDISTLLVALGLDLAPGVRLLLRLAAAFGTLVLSFRITALRNAKATGLALLVLATCYIGLFNPRQENVSFLVVVPSVAAIGVVMLSRDLADWRGGVWLGLAALIGTKMSMAHGGWIFPSIMIVIWAGLVALMASPGRWVSLIAGLPASELRPRMAESGDRARAKAV